MFEEWEDYDQMKEDHFDSLDYRWLDHDRFQNEVSEYPAMQEGQMQTE